MRIKHKVRAPLFNLIMHGKDGLSSGERELGAVGASIVNRCVYCTAVHALRFNTQAKRTDVIDAHKNSLGPIVPKAAVLVPSIPIDAPGIRATCTRRLVRFRIRLMSRGQREQAGGLMTAGMRGQRRTGLGA